MGVSRSPERVEGGPAVTDEEDTAVAPAKEKQRKHRPSPRRDRRPSESNKHTIDGGATDDPHPQTDKLHIPANKPRGPAKERHKKSGSSRRDGTGRLMKDRSTKSDRRDLDASGLSRSGDGLDASGLSISAMGDSTAEALDQSNMSQSNNTSKEERRQHRRKRRGSKPAGRETSRDKNEQPLTSGDEDQQPESISRPAPERRRRPDRKSSHREKRENSQEKDAEKNDIRRRKPERTRSKRRLPEHSRSGSSGDPSASSTDQPPPSLPPNSRREPHRRPPSRATSSTAADPLHQSKHQKQRRTPGRAVSSSAATMMTDASEKTRALAERRRRRTALLDASVRDGSDNASERRRLPPTPSRSGSSVDTSNNDNDEDKPSPLLAERSERTDRRRTRRSERHAATGDGAAPARGGGAAPFRRHKTLDGIRSRLTDDASTVVTAATAPSSTMGDNSNGSHGNSSSLKKPPPLRRARTGDVSPVRSSIRDRRASRRPTAQNFAAQALVNAVDFRDTKEVLGVGAMYTSHDEDDDDDEEGNNNNLRATMDRSGGSHGSGPDVNGIDDSIRSTSTTSSKMGLKKMIPASLRRLPWKSSNKDKSTPATCEEDLLETGYDLDD